MSNLLLGATRITTAYATGPDNFTDGNTGSVGNLQSSGAPYNTTGRVVYDLGIAQAIAQVFANIDGSLGTLQFRGSNSSDMSGAVTLGNISALSSGNYGAVTGNATAFQYIEVRAELNAESAVTIVIYELEAHDAVVGGGGGGRTPGRMIAAMLRST